MVKPRPEGKGKRASLSPNPLKTGPTTTVLVLKYLSTARPLAGLLAEVPPPNSSGSIGLSMAAVLGSLLFEVLLYTLLGW